MDRNKKLYEKSKYIVKKWEGEFRKITKNLPTKADIKAAPTKIKDAYKTYWSLKNSSIKGVNYSCDISDENAKDCFNSSSEMLDVNSSSLALDNSKSNITTTDDSICFQLLSETLNDSQSFLNILDQESAKSFPQDTSNTTETVQSNKTEESSHKKKNEMSHSSFQNLFNKNKVDNLGDIKELDEVDVKKLKIKSLSSQYAKKLFAGSKFKKRNPRKPREFIRSKTTSSINDTSTNATLEVVNKTLSFIEPDGPCSQETGFSNLSESSSFTHCHDDSALTFNDKFKIVNQETHIQSQPVSLLQKSFDSSTTKLSLCRNVDKGWLERIEELHNISEKKAASSPTESEDSGISLTKSDPPVTTPFSKCISPKDNDSDDDLIYDSDCDSQSQSFCKLNLFELSRSSSNLGFVRNEASTNCFAVKLKVVDQHIPNSQNPVDKASDVLTEDAVNYPRKRFLDSSESTGKPSKRPKIQSSIEIINEYNFTSTTKPELILPDNNCKIQSTKSICSEVKMNEKDAKKMALLEKKMASGSANENFVRINIEKKKYSRGKKSINFSKYKKQKWKEAKKNSNYMTNSGILKCFKCGDVGHFSKACPKKLDELLPLEDYDSAEESPFPTLEEAAEMAKEAAEKAHKGGRKFTKANQDDLPEPENDDTILHLGDVKPIYNLKPDGSLIDTPPEVYQALKELGHTSFRFGQEEGVMRILSGVSTLVTLSTGSGKSLIYQLPAYLYNKQKPGCITLVISPLISLMEDQIFCGSKKLHAACLHHNMTQKKREVVIESLKARTVSVLLIAPESLSSWDSAKSLLKILPPIAFVCIDEAHSISQFSHNFRPSYLTICQTLREKLGIKTFLGLTATASRATLDTVMSQLGIVDDSSVISDIPLPDNLHLSVSIEENRREALITLLHSEKLKVCDSIIVYCTRREECDSIAGFLRVALQENDAPNKKGRLSLHAEAYHAGLTAGRRNQVQSAFMSGKLRIVVATVAFGMGINKNDIRAIIHYNMPYSFESYVQEVGRAGRDGKLAHCHLFLDSKRNDLCELQRHIYADTMERMILRKLLQMIFIPCDCLNKKSDVKQEETSTALTSFGLQNDIRGKCILHEVAFPIEDTVKLLDLPQEVISTLLAYLQLDKKKWIQVLPLAYIKCKIISYKGAKNLKTTGKNCPPLAVVIAESPKDASFVEFDIFKLARKINWDSGTIKHTLKNLEWTMVDGKPKRTGITVEFSCLGFRVLSPGNLDDTQLDEALDLLHSIVLEQEESKLKHLKLFYESLKRVSYQSLNECSDTVNLELSNKLKSEVREYFSRKDPIAEVHLTDGEIQDEAEVISDIRRLICMYKDEAILNGRNVARIFHGIGSPNFAPYFWGRTKFWRLHLDKDFNSLVKLSNKQIILMK